jgi:hypothetical protein
MMMTRELHEGGLAMLREPFTSFETSDEMSVAFFSVVDPKTDLTKPSGKASD